MRSSGGGAALGEVVSKEIASCSFLEGRLPAVAQNANKGVSVSQTHNIGPVDTVFLKKPVFGILTKDLGGVGNRFSVNSSSGYRIGCFLGFWYPGGYHNEKWEQDL